MHKMARILVTPSNTMQNVYNVDVESFEFTLLSTAVALYSWSLLSFFFDICKKLRFQFRLYVSLHDSPHISTYFSLSVSPSLSLSLAPPSKISISLWPLSLNCLNFLHSSRSSCYVTVIWALSKIFRTKSKWQMKMICFPSICTAYNADMKRLDEAVDVKDKWNDTIKSALFLGGYIKNANISSGIPGTQLDVTYIFYILLMSHVKLLGCAMCKIILHFQVSVRVCFYCY